MSGTVHKVEGAVTVYLNFDSGDWQIDHINFDTYPLDGPDVTAADCECDDKTECGEVVDQAARTSYPSGQQLAGMLIAWLAEASFHQRRGAT